MFKYLIFITGLKYLNDADMRMWLISKLEQDKNMKALTAKCERLWNLKKKDTIIVQQQHLNSSTTSSIQVQKNWSSMSQQTPYAS